MKSWFFGSPRASPSDWNTPSVAHQRHHAHLIDGGHTFTGTNCANVVGIRETGG